MRNRLSRTFLFLAAPLVLCSCQGVFFGNLAVLAITVGIFMGTISLGRG
jgi:hypothetical protein